MRRASAYLALILTGAAPACAFHNFKPDFLPQHSELDIFPLYNGLPPEGISPLALGFYATPEVIDPVELEVEGDIPS